MTSRFLHRPPALLVTGALLVVVARLSSAPADASGAPWAWSAIGLMGGLTLLGLWELWRQRRSRHTWAWGYDATLWLAVAVAGPLLDRSAFFRANLPYVFYLGMTWFFALGAGFASLAVRIWDPPPTGATPEGAHPRHVEPGRGRRALRWLLVTLALLAITYAIIGLVFLLLRYLGVTPGAPTGGKGGSSLLSWLSWTIPALGLGISLLMWVRRRKRRQYRERLESSVTVAGNDESHFVLFASEALYQNHWRLRMYDGYGLLFRQGNEWSFQGRLRADGSDLTLRFSPDTATVRLAPHPLASSRPGVWSEVTQDGRRYYFVPDAKNGRALVREARAIFTALAAQLPPTT